jgi:hypothetical protein
MEKLPIYELKINEDLTDNAEVSYISLVDAPAIKRTFEYFKEQFISPSKGEQKDEFLNRCIPFVIKEGKESDQAVAICNSMWEEHFVNKEPTDMVLSSFQIVNSEQRIISGPLILADMLIYRNNEQFGEHYVKFSADTIKAIAIKWAKRKNMDKVNLMHDQAQVVAGVTMFESWITDSSRGILPMKGYEDVADGSWFGSFYVENSDVWNSIKDGSYKGFSVEGLFDYDQPKSPEELALAKIANLLNCTELE